MTDDQGIFSTFVELEIKVKDLTKLVGFCFDYMPSSIEILGPKVLSLKESEFTTVMNDLQGKLHRLDMAVKNLNSENKMLQKNAYFLATNLFHVLIGGGVKSIDDLTKMGGMTKENTEEFLKKLEGQGLVKKDGDSYTWLENDKRKEQS